MKLLELLNTNTYTIIHSQLYIIFISYIRQKKLFFKKKFTRIIAQLPDTPFINVKF